MLTVLLLLPAAFMLNTYILWTYFLAVMRLQQVRDAGALPPAAMTAGRAVLFVGLVLDCLFNWTWATLIYLDPPREFLLTSRMERYKFGSDKKSIRFMGWRPVLVVVGRTAPSSGWRVSVTDWAARVLLDPFDPSGSHLRR